MEVKQINQLMLAMRKTGVKRLVLKKEGVELELELEGNEMHPSFDGSLEGFMEENPMRQEIESHRRSATVAETKTGVKAEDEEKDTAVYVTSPMVGSVYYAPSPTDPVFVKPGDRVEKNTVVCIIEAMKVMNEVKAGVSGIVLESLVENGHPVEFGTKLLRVAPQ
jgi:acetyl-CoA carboxylase biotin carboxyl carrier protein